MSAKKFIFTAAQGEITIRRIGKIPEGVTTRPVASQNGMLIVAHSESGNHHFIPAKDGDLMEHTGPVPAGMRILYAIVRTATALAQDAAKPHDALVLEPGVYAFRISREFDPFAQQARRVAD